MPFIYVLAVLVVLNIIYVIGFLGAQVLSGSPQHFFLGFNPGLITFKLKGVKFNLGLYIPIIGLARIYRVDDQGNRKLFYPWQVRHTSLMKRLLLSYSGVLALIGFGIVLSILDVYMSKIKYIPKEQVIKYGIYPSPQARAFGFLPGDKITSLNGADYSDFYELVHPDVINSEQTNYTILREGKEITISLAADTIPILPQQELFLTINSPFLIGKVSPESPAAQAGILPGDRIVKVNDHPISSSQEMNFYFKSDEDGEVVLEVSRGENGQQTFQKTVALNEYNQIGVYLEQMIEYKNKEYSFLKSLTLGPVRFWSNTVVQFRVFAKTVGLLTSQEKRKLSGPVRISESLGSFSFPQFVSFTSLYISFAIILNMLPLPKSVMLEVIPLGYEALTRKPFSYKLFRRIRQVSIVLVVALIVLQLVSDIIRLFKLM